MEGSFGGAFEGREWVAGRMRGGGKGGEMMGVGVAPDRVAERWWWWGGGGCGQAVWGGWGVERLCGGVLGTGRSCADGLIGG